MARQRDYYEVLGVPRNASEQQIKSAYRRLARQFHPDVNQDNPQAAERFKEISQAYTVLSDRKRRRSYDLFGAGTSTRGEDPFAGFTDLGDLFSELFKSRPKKPGPRPGVDIEVPLRLSLEEAVSGVRSTVSFDAVRPCADCNGSGAKGGVAQPCPECGGDGVRRARGPVPFTRSCHRCGGTGRDQASSCARCRGAWVVRQPEKLRVTIPPGVCSGARVRVRGKGDSGQQGGHPGDLYVVIEVEQNPTYRREQDSLHMEVQIPFHQAILGGTVEVPTLDGVVSMQVPPGTQGGQRFRLKGKGTPRLHGGGRGDLFVQVQLTVPRSIDQRARDLLAAFVAQTDTAPILDQDGASS